MATAVADVAQLQRPLTYEDLVDFPEGATRYEVLQGELVVTPAPTPKHVRLSTQLGIILGAFLRDHQLGGILFSSPVDVVLGPHDVVEPDLCFVSRERRHIIGDVRIDGAPDLVIEIFSPSTRRRDLVQKRALYAQAGIREYWQVDPAAKSVTVLTLTGDRYDPVEPSGSRVASTVIAGFEFDMPELFEMDEDESGN